MPEYQFQSNAGSAIQKYLLDQAARDRQTQLDAQTLAHQQEQERLAREQEQRMAEVATQAQKVQNEQLKIQQAAADRATQIYEQGQHQIGEELTPDMTRNLPPSTVQPGNPAIAGAPGIIAAAPTRVNVGGADMQFPGAEGRAATPSSPATPTTYKGNEKQQAMDELMKNERITPEIRQMIRAGVLDDTALARLLAPASTSENEPILRTNYQKGAIEQYKGVTSDGKPIWEPYNSPTRPKGSTIMSAPDPLLSEQRGVTIQLGNQMAGNMGGAGADLPKDVVDTINSATMNIVGRKRGVVRQTLAASYDHEDPSTFNTQLTNSVVAAEDPQTGRAVEGRRDALKALDQAKNIMEQLKASGVDTGILRGSAEDLVRKLGTTTDPKLVALGSQLNQTLFEYRRAMTGVQFSQKEAETYNNIFPKYTNDFDVNSTLINQMTSFMGKQQKNFWDQRGVKPERLSGTVWDIGERGGGGGATTSETATSETPYQRYLRMQKGK